MAMRRQQRLLNKGPSRKRFVFKAFGQRIKELDVNVFRSLDTVKLEPTQGTSFFHESLLQWRELNSAADFLEIYEQLWPIVQTLPQLVLHKDLVINTLLSHIQLSAILSLEPIMSLIAILSRDLQADFIPFIPQLLNCCMEMLRAGGDREPDVIEQIFASFSLILKYMQKLLSKDIVFVLKVTKQMRYYHRSYIQEFTAEAVSFLLRKASLRQIVKGLQMIYAEVVSDPSDENISSCSTLLWHTLKGPASNLQSRAEPVIRILLKLPFLKSSRKKDPGGEMIVKVIAKTFCRLCDELPLQKLSLLWHCLLDKIHQLLDTCNKIYKENEVNGSIEFVHVHAGVFSNSRNTGVMDHANGTELWGIDSERPQDTLQDTKLQLVYNISLLNNILEFRRGRRVSEFGSLLSLSQRLVQSRIFTEIEKGSSVEFLAPLSPVKLYTASISCFHVEVLRFLLALVRSCNTVGGTSSEPLIFFANAPFWDSFELTWLLPLVCGLLEEDTSVILPFASSLLRVFNRFILSDPVAILPLMLDFLYKFEMTQYLLAIVGQQNIERIGFFITTILKEAIQRLGADILVEHNDFHATAQDLSLEPAIVWAALLCFTFVRLSNNDSSSLPWNYAMQLSHFLLALEDCDDSKDVWEQLLGAALLSDLKANVLKRVHEYLNFAFKHRHSPYVLNAVADFLDCYLRSSCVATSEYPSDLREDKSFEALKLLEENLAKPSKLLRLSTLRILTKYAFNSSNNQDSLNCQKVFDCMPSTEEDKSVCNVLELLLSIEASPFCLEVSRQSSLAITRLKVHATTGRIAECFLTALAHAMIGVFHNPFKPLWDSAVDCLAGLLEIHSDVTWDIFIHHLQSIQFLFLSIGESLPDIETAHDGLPKDLWSRFEHSFRNKEGITDTGTLLILLLQVLERVPEVAESRSRHLVPLFFTFVEYSDMAFQRDAPIAPRRGKKEWRAVLKEWLGLLRSMKNAQSFSKGQIVKEIIMDRFLMDTDFDIQQRAFDCLLNWKDTFLIPYEENLKKLISWKTLREELTTWNVGKEGQQVQNEHRGGLIPILARILFSKIMKANSKSAKKSKGGIQRSTILSFLARLEVGELLPFFILLLRPFESTFGSKATELVNGKKAWEVAMDLGPKANFIEWVEVGRFYAIPLKKKAGFLHLVRDALGTFAQAHLGGYLHALLALVFRILESWSVNTGFQDLEINSGLNDDDLTFFNELKRGKIHSGSGGNIIRSVESSATKEVGITTGSAERIMLKELVSDEGKSETSYEKEKPSASDGVTEEISLENASERSNDDAGVSRAIDETRFKTTRKELRTLGFRILAIVFDKYADLDFSSVYWDIFLSTIRPLVARFRQESISSETPSTLFSCFLAISRNLNLFPVLLREKDLIPNVISILSDRTASSSLIHAVLSFIENILDLDNDINAYGRKAVSEVIVENLSLLLSGIQDLLKTRQSYCRDKKLFSAGRELQILRRLCKYIKNPSEASKLVLVLLPFLKLKKHANIEECQEVLHVMKELSTVLDIEKFGEILLLFGPILASTACQDIRITICQVLEEFAHVDPSLCFVAKLISDLNSSSTITIGEYDYDRRMQAYDSLSPTLFSELDYVQSLLVISQAAYDMGEKDIAIRHSSSSCLVSFIHFASCLFSKQQEASGNEDIVDQEQQNISMEIEGNISPAAAMTKEKNQLSWSLQSVNAIVQKVIFTHVRNAMRINSSSVQKEWILILREMAVNLQNDPSLSEFLPLISTDLEVDFFHNICHIQSHRRTRALSRFKSVCSAGRFSQGTLVRIFIPLFMNLLLEAKGETEGNLVTAAIDALSCISAQLVWEAYSSFLIRLFRMISSKHGNEKVLVRLVCSVVDSFHFFGTNCEKQGIQEVNMDLEKERFEEHPNHDLGNAFNDVEIEHKEQKLDSKIRLQKQLLPQLTKLLVSNENIVNTKVALAVVKILKLMPEEIIELELPRIVQSIVNLLKNRSQAVRDEARSALVAVVKVLGASYLHFIVNSLQSSLTRGFEVHVLGFTLYSILTNLVPLITVGQIDYCADRILEVLENDMFGDVSEEKAVEKIASKMKETKRIQSFESIRLLAQVVTFKTHATILLKPAKENLHRSLTPNIKLKIEMMLRQLALGIQENPSFSQEELLIFLHGIVENGIMEEKIEKKVGTFKLINADLSVTKDHSQKQSLQDRSSMPNLHLLTEFGLQLLHNHLKHLPRDKLDVHALSMLDPFVSLLQGCLGSKYEGVLSSSMKCLCQLLRITLPSIATSGCEILNAVLSMAEKFGMQDSPLVRACFDLLIALLKHNSHAEVSNEQLQILLQLPIFIDLESSGSSTGLLLLKAIVRRKLLIPELYDVINRIQQLMVASQVAVVRKYCSQILLQFLLDYPLGFKRLQQHLDFFVTNLSYEHSCGREAALEMLHAVIVKFPGQVVDEQLDTLFIPLVTRLVNDEAKHVREMIGTVLRILMGRVSQRSLQRMLDFCFSWLRDKKQHLWRPAAQVLGFLIEIMKGKFSQYVQDAVLATENILRYTSDFEESTDSSSGSAFWQEAYYALKLFEKLLTQFPDIFFQKTFEKLWNLTCSFLLHQHIWLRKVSSDLVGKYFVACELSNEATGFLLEGSMLMSLAAIFCEQLDTNLLDDSLAEQITKNLLFVTRTLYHSMHSPNIKTSWAEIVNNADPSVQVRVSDALDLLGLGRLKTHANIVDIHQITEDVQIEDPKQETAYQGKSYFLLWPIFRKLKEISLQIELVQTKATLKWYVAISTELGPDGVQPYMSSMMLPLYKISESCASKNIPDELKILSEEVLNHIKELVGVSKFVQAYNEARQAVKGRREERKHANKLNVLIDPERHAKRKMSLSIKHQAQKKRKILRAKS